MVTFKQLIDSKGITMYRLAKDAGVGKSTVSQLATGKRKTAYMGTLVKIAKVLNVSVDEVYNSLKEEANEGIAGKRNDC